MLAKRIEPDAREGDRRFLLRGVPWWTYVALRDVLDHQGGVKMTYLKGALEFMSPSTLREDAKKMIARLLEVWAMERNLDLRGFGGATFRREAKERGLEPDECYKLGKLEEDGVPDIAIEVIVSAPLVDKMEVYAGLGVPEVWIWRPEGGGLEIHLLADGRYQRADRSKLLPEVDVAELARFVQPGENQTALAKAYQSALNER